MSKPADSQKALENLPADIAEEPVRRLSAKAAHPNGRAMTEDEIEAAEAEAEAWARRVNCC